MKRAVSASLAVFAACLVSAAAGALPQAAEKRPISEKDLFSFVWVADPQISPDGSQVAFVRVTRRREEGRVRNRHLDREDRWQRAAARDHERHPRHQPALVARRPPARVRAIGREGRACRSRRRFTSWRCPAASRARSPISRAAPPIPSGRQTARRSRSRRATRPAELSSAAQKRAGRQAPRESDVRVITEAVYRANGVAGFGYVDRDRPAQIWTVAAPAGPADTSGAEGDHVGRVRRRQLPLVSGRLADLLRLRPAPRVVLLPARQRSLSRSRRTAASRRRSSASTATIGAYAFSPDGKRAGLRRRRSHGNPERSYTQPDLWVVDIPGGAPRNLTAGYDFDINGGLGGDQRAPRGQLAERSRLEPRRPRRSSINVGEQGNANLKRVDVASGKIDAGDPRQQRRDVVHRRRERAARSPS